MFMSQQILRLPDVIKKTGLCRSMIYRLLNQGKFPKRIKLSERSMGFYEHEVDAWLESRAAQRDEVSE
jgi:prophage regulatory protein